MTPLSIVALFLLAAQGDFQAQFVSGLRALNEQNLPVAQAALQAASQLQPADPRVWVALAQTYWKLRKTALAAEAAAKAEKLGADDPVTLRSLATFYSEQKEFLRAGDLEARCAARDTRDPSATTRAMLDYLQAGQPGKAIDLALATPGWEARADIRNLLGKAYEAHGQILKTIPELQEAIRLKGDEESYYFDLTRVLLSHYNFDAAIRIGELGRKRFPASAQMALATGVAYYGQNQPDVAVDMFLETVALDPDIEQPYLFLARLMNQGHDKLPAIAQRFVDYQERNPQSYLGYFLHAKALMAEFTEPEQAESLLRKSVTLNGEYWEAHYNLGILLTNRRAFEEAAREFRRSTELNPKDPTAHYRLFRVLATLGKTQEAEAELARQRKVSEESQADLTRHLGTVKVLEIPAIGPEDPR